LLIGGRAVRERGFVAAHRAAATTGRRCWARRSRRGWSASPGCQDSSCGSIGQGLPVAIGAAVACPDRPVISLEGDGSAMYTLPALWTRRTRVST
jgi:thiamine pyrophosphate-dependent acetolactate synthase large subunit-like protein